VLLLISPFFHSHLLQVQSGQEAKNTVALFGLNDIVGDLGFSCNQLPINAVGGAAAIGTECKATSGECWTGEGDGVGSLIRPLFPYLPNSLPFISFSPSLL